MLWGRLFKREPAKPTYRRKSRRQGIVIQAPHHKKHIRIHAWQKNWLRVDCQVVTLACASGFLKSLRFFWYSLNLLLNYQRCCAFYWKCSTSRVDSLDTKKQSLPRPQSGITEPCMWYITYIDGWKLEIAVNPNHLGNPNPPYRESTGLDQGRQRKLLMKKRRERRI